MQTNLTTVAVDRIPFEEEANKVKFGTPDEKRVALIYLGTFYGDRARDVVRLIEHTYFDSDMSVRWASASALQALGVSSRSLTPELVPLLDHSTPLERLRAAYALSGTGCALSKVVTTLASHLATGSERGRVRAVMGLMRLGKHAGPALSIVLKSTNDSSPRVRSKVAIVMRYIGEKEDVIPHLNRMLEDADPGVRRSALWTLVQRGESSK